MPGGLWTQVPGTTRAGEVSGAVAQALGFFATTVPVPPLRLHVEDLSALVPFLLARIGVGGRLSCAPDAMRLLMRYPWPGNVRQLADVLQQTVHQRRGG